MLKKAITVSLLAFSLPTIADTNTQFTSDYAFIQGMGLAQLQFDQVLQTQMLRQQETRLDQLSFQRQELSSRA